MKQFTDRRPAALAVSLWWLLLGRTAAAAPGIVHEPETKTVTISDGAGDLVLRLRYDGRCMIDRVAVRGRDVVPLATGVCTSLRAGAVERTTRSGIPEPKVVLSASGVEVSGIRFGAAGIEAEETWTLSSAGDRIDWRISRKYLTGGDLDDTYFPGWDFSSPSTWTGALLGTGGVAWFKLFDTPVATYGVHAGPVTFWNKDTGDCLRIVPAVPPGKHIAARFSRHPHGVVSFNHSVADEDLATQHGQARFLRDRQDVWKPFRVSPGEVTVELALQALDYREAYDRGTFAGIDGTAVAEICNTIARLGAVDRYAHGSNGWYSGYAVLHEQWLAQLGLAIDDPDYFRSYAETLDYQRDRAIGPDGRVKPRWAYGPWDAIPGTYDAHGFYECQWGYLLDSQPSWVINVAEQFDLSGDVEWVRRHKETTERVLDYMLRRDSNGNGLVEVMTDSHRERRGSEWLDVVWASFEAATINAPMYHALVLWADVEEVLGDPARAARYRAAASKLKEAFDRPVSEGGFWQPEHGWYVHWRDKDGSIHGDNLVLPVNFMAIAYGLCTDPGRRAAILGRIEAEMRKEKLFFWPICMYSYAPGECKEDQYPFPTYENGDIFLAWGELGTRAYAGEDPRIPIRYIRNVLDQYGRDGLAFQRYLRATQRGAGGDILANNCSPVVGLYRDIFGIQPKWNRLYLEPHIATELAGTRLRYRLRGQLYAIDLALDGHRITVDGFTVNGARPLAVRAGGDTLEYFAGDRKTPSMAVTRPAGVRTEIRIEAWPTSGDGARKWTVTCPEGDATVRHALSELAPGARYRLTRSGGQAEPIAAGASGRLEFEATLEGSRPRTFLLEP